MYLANNTKGFVVYFDKSELAVFGSDYARISFDGNGIESAINVEAAERSDVNSVMIYKPEKGTAYFAVGVQRTPSWIPRFSQTVVPDEKVLQERGLFILKDLNFPLSDPSINKRGSNKRRYFGRRRPHKPQQYVNGEAVAPDFDALKRAVSLINKNAKAGNVRVIVNDDNSINLVI